MKDRAARSGGSRSGEFDLDSFLKDNNFLADEGNKRTSEDSRDRGLAQKTAAVKAQDAKPKQTASLGVSIEAPEPKSSAKKPGKSPKDSKPQALRKPAPTMKKPVTTDSNATMTFAAAGVGYPEIPMVEEQNTQTSTGTNTAAGTKKQAGAKPVEPRPISPDTTADIASALIANQLKKKTSDDRTLPATQHEPGPTGKTTSQTEAKAASNPGEPGKARTGQIQAAARRSNQVSEKRARTVAAGRRNGRYGNVKGKGVQNKPRLKTLANPEDYQSADISDNSYRIRGGGRRHNHWTPMLIAAISLVCVAGIGLIAYLLVGMYNSMMDNSTDEPVVTLTTAETRQAIDAEMPRILDHVLGAAPDAYNTFLANGWSVYFSERATTDNPDRTSGGEIIRLAAGVSPDALSGYYESEFNAYDFDTLQKDFNGAWFLDLSHGSQGALGQLKYINFAADTNNDPNPLRSELLHLRSLQGLDGAGSVLLSEGDDDFGNTFAQGTITVGETKYYWRLIGIGLNEYYGGQDDRTLPKSAVFVKCSVSTFDFYGAAALEKALAASTGVKTDPSTPAAGVSTGA
ncbi:MAG TPA: hypothetical protein DEB24_01435 [Coriobacteriia bacterium]|nr:hypothetical protein [Coriobacteriia bacterium]